MGTIRNSWYLLRVYVEFANVYLLCGYVASFLLLQIECYIKCNFFLIEGQKDRRTTAGGHSPKKVENRWLSYCVCHWRRMGHWGTCPPRLPASYFGDHSLYRLWRVVRTVFCPVERFLAIGSAYCHWIVALLCLLLHWGPCPSPQSTTRKKCKRTNTENVRKQLDFCAIFINFWPIFVIFCPQFSSGSNYSSQNDGTIANKFQLHTYFRFR